MNIFDSYRPLIIGGIIFSFSIVYSCYVVGINNAWNQSIVKYPDVVAALIFGIVILAITGIGQLNYKNEQQSKPGVKQ